MRTCEELQKPPEKPPEPGGSTRNPLYKRQVLAAREAVMVTGAYHFLVETPPKAQADHFLSTIGDDIDGLMLAVDFEAYNYPYGYLTPGNATLEGFIDSLRARIGEHPIMIYSGRGFWNGCDPSSTFRPKPQARSPTLSKRTSRSGSRSPCELASCSTGTRL